MRGAKGISFTFAFSFTCAGFLRVEGGGCRLVEGDGDSVLYIRLRVDAVGEKGLEWRTREDGAGWGWIGLEGRGGWKGWLGGWKGG